MKRRLLLCCALMAAGCAQSSRPVASRHDDFPKKEGYPLWVNLEHVPDELRARGSSSSAEQGARDATEETSPSEKLHCAICVIVVDPRLDYRDLNPIFSRVTAEEFTYFTPDECARIAHDNSLPGEPFSSRGLLYSVYENGLAIFSRDGMNSGWLWGLAHSVRPIEITRDACRFIFAAQGTDRANVTRGVPERVWHMADEIQLAVGQYGGRLATGTSEGRPVLLVVGVQSIALPEPWPSE